jgi:hypothetical protein
MTRAIVALALASGIAPSVWFEQDPRVIDTAFELLAERDDEQGTSGTGGRVMGG